MIDPEDLASFLLGSLSKEWHNGEQYGLGKEEIEWKPPEPFGTHPCWSIIHQGLAVLTVPVPVPVLSRCPLLQYIHLSSLFSPILSHFPKDCVGAKRPPNALLLTRRRSGCAPGWQMKANVWTPSRPFLFTYLRFREEAGQSSTQKDGSSAACQPVGLENGANPPAEWFPRSQGPGLRQPNSEVDGGERSFRVNLHCKHGRPRELKCNSRSSRTE
ncbi:hypothetical protein JRQ81_011802, partial [Phrynocephalus forsythii]